MTICFDLDGTLCTNTEGAYEHATPLADAIAQVNRLHAEGHRIIICTARGSTTGIDWRATTERQLTAWGIRYHELWLGKPTADIYVDDKAINAAEWRRSGWHLAPTHQV